MAAIDEPFDPTAEWAGDSTALKPLDPLGPMEPVDWLVEDFLARGTITMVAGEAGAGKSAMTQHLAVTMANAAAAGLDEDDCAGLTVRAGKVLIVDAENGANLVRSRLQAAGLTVAGAEHCQVRLADDFDLSTGVAQCRALLAAERPDMVVLDSLSSLWSGSISSVTAVKKVIRSLRSLATVLSQAARGTDVVGRLGGDEFAMLLHEADQDAALEVAMRLKDAMQAANGSDLVTASLGVSTWQGIADRPEDLLRRADEALYIAKRAGRNRCAQWEPPASEAQAGLHWLARRPRRAVASSGG